MKRLKKGFTLIELLVVIAIIGILATTLAPKLREQLAKAKDAKAIALLGVARTAGSVVMVDSMVNSITSSSITFGAIKAKLDTKSQAMVNDDGSNITIGGNRVNSSTDTLVYGGTIAITSGGSIDISKDEVSLNFNSTEFSTEGKAWNLY